MNLQALWEQLGRPGRPGEGFPFLGLCIFAGLIGLAFVGAIILDTVRQNNRKPTWMRTAEAAARKRTRAAAKGRIFSRPELARQALEKD
jgi:hypothetical protein